MQRLYSSVRTSYQLTELSPYTLYSVSVAAIGSLGKSPFSKSLLVRTLATGSFVYTVKVLSYTKLLVRNC